MIRENVCVCGRKTRAVVEIFDGVVMGDVCVCVSD